MKRSLVTSLIAFVLLIACTPSPTATPFAPAVPTPQIMEITPTPWVVTATPQATDTPTLVPSATPPTPAILSWENHSLVDELQNVAFKNDTAGYKRQEIYGSNVILSTALRWVVNAQVDRLKADVGEASTGLALLGYGAEGKFESFYLVYQNGQWHVGYQPDNSNNRFTYWRDFRNLTDPKQNLELSILDGGKQVDVKNDQGFESREDLPVPVFTSAEAIIANAQIGPYTKITLSKLSVQTPIEETARTPTTVVQLATIPTPISSPTQGQPEYVFHIAVNGSDTNPGTSDKPFATLGHARDVIRSISSNMSGPIVVYIHGGVYHVGDAMQFGPEDSGQNGYDIVYSAAPEETPIFSGGVEVDGWTKMLGSSLWKTVLPQVEDFRQVYVNGARAQRAASRLPITGMGWATGDFSDKDGILISASRLPDLARPQDLELHWIYDWNDMRLPVKSVTSNPDGTKTLWMRQPYFSYALFMSTFGNNTHQWFPRYDVPFYLENASELLDQPGEWYYNRDTRELFYWPRQGEDMNTARVVIPETETLMQISGGPVGREVHNLDFEGLSFAYAGWTRANQVGTFGWQAQNLIKRPCWAMYCTEMTPAHIQVTSANNIRFSACRFEHLGAVALGLNNNVFKTTVRGNLFQDISDAAVVVGHWDDAYITAPAIQAPARDNLIADNLIKDVGVEYWGAPAITAYYVSNLQIVHNEISNVPYTGISLGWGWSSTTDSTTSHDNRISNNLITDLLLRARDGGGIYTLGQQPGTVVQGNVIRRAKGDWGCLYPDEGSAYISFRNNVCDAAAQWLNIWIKSIHDIEVLNSFTNVATLRNDGGANIQIQKTVLVNGESWPPEAQAIMSNAGLEAAYSYLRAWINNK